MQLNLCSKCTCIICQANHEVGFPVSDITRFLCPAVLDARNFFIASALFGYFLDVQPGIFVHCVFLIFLDSVV
jgi:hypothetical protein